MKEFYLPATLLLPEKPGQVSSSVALVPTVLLGSHFSSFGNTTQQYAKVPTVFGKSVSAKIKQTALKNEPLVKEKAPFKGAFSFTNTKEIIFFSKLKSPL